jgi:hypothetical protein
LPQTFEWFALSVILVFAGAVSRLLGTLGCLGIIIWIATAILSAALADGDGREIPRSSRVTLAMLYLIGPLVRSFERARVRFSLAPDADDVPTVPFSSRGRIIFSAENGSVVDKMDSAALLAGIRARLVKYGLAVAATDGFKAWDLNIVLAPAIRVPLNALRMSDGTVALAWRSKSEPTRTIVAAAVIFIALIACGLSAIGAIGTTALIIAIAVAPVIVRLQRVPSLLAAAAEAIANARGLKIAVHPGETF